MSNFDVNVSGVQSGADTGQRPVVDNSTASTIGALGNLAGGFLDSFGRGRAEYTKKLQAQQIGSAEADLSTRLTAIQDAREQGNLSEAQSRVRARAAYNQAITNNPLIRDKLSETYSSIINTKGLGDSIAEQTAQEKLVTDQWKKALDAGFAHVDDTPEMQQANIANYQKFERDQANLSWAKQQLEYASAKVGLTNANLETISKRQSIATGAINQQRAQLGLATDKAEFAARSTVGSMAQSYGEKSQNDIDQVLKAVQDGRLQQKDAIIKLQGMKSDYNTLATQQLGGFGAQYVGAIAGPNNDRFDNAVKLVSGEIDKTVYDNGTHNLKAREQFNAMTTNPDILRYAAGSDLFKNSPEIAMRFANSGAAAYLAQKSQDNAPASSVTSSDPGHKAAVKGSLDVIKQGMTKVNSNLVPKGDTTPQEIPVQLNNFFKDIRASELQQNNPSDYNDVVSFLASNDFGNYMKSHGNTLTDPKAMEAAGQVMEREYSQHAVDVVYKEFVSKNTAMDAPSGGPFAGVSLDQGGVVDTTKRPSAITASYAAGGVTFKALDPNNKAAVKSAQDLNRQAAPVLTNVVKLSAHLQGSTDYNAIWKDRFATRFDLDKNEIGQQTPKLSDVAAGN